MANWARTDYRIEGNQEDLQEIYYLCKAFDNGERPVMEDGASKGLGRQYYIGYWHRKG